MRLTPPPPDVTKIELPTITKKRGRPTVLPLKHLNMCVELIDSLRLKGAVISGSIIKGIVVGIIEANFSNLMEKEDVNYDNVRQVLHHYQTKKPRFICEIGEKLAKYGKNQINGLENGLEKSKNVTKIVVD